MTSFGRCDRVNSIPRQKQYDIYAILSFVHIQVVIHIREREKISDSYDKREPGLHKLKVLAHAHRDIMVGINNK